MQHPIIKVVSQSVTLLPEEEVFILSYFIKQHHKRNEILMQEGEMAQHIFFVVQGALQQFYVEDNGIEHTCNFIFENEFITDLESFSKKVPPLQALKPLSQLYATVSPVPT